MTVTEVLRDDLDHQYMTQQSVINRWTKCDDKYDVSKPSQNLSEQGPTKMDVPFCDALTEFYVTLFTVIKITIYDNTVKPSQKVCTFCDDVQVFRHAVPLATVDI